MFPPPSLWGWSFWSWMLFLYAKTTSLCQKNLSKQNYFCPIWPQNQWLKASLSVQEIFCVPHLKKRSPLGHCHDLPLTSTWLADRCIHVCEFIQYMWQQRWTFCADVEKANCNHSELLLHISVRWLSQGKFLQRFWELSGDKGVSHSHQICRTSERTNTSCKI